ncbi:MAG: TIGR04348 family glycosyltransferase [Methylibium sp.]|nr:TIGR04348 family glycosyltransferase [Methylibium sp.]
MGKPRVCIVSPAAAGANNGNWHTASRWQRFLAPLAEVEITLTWDGTPADALIALHARRSAESIERFAGRHPHRPLALVLTGTDLYRDLESNASARHSVECASHLIVLQEQGLHRLGAGARAKARVIVQSAPRLVRHDRARRRFDLVAVGHLREEKDPLTLMRAARLLPTDTKVRIHHIGNALDADLQAAAERCAMECAAYRWLGGLAHTGTRRWIARSRALVHMSRMEGGANVLIEALRSRVPVLASRIDGNVGLLGSGYDGYFKVGDAQALAALMQRFASDPDFAAHLQAQCAVLEPRFTPAVESAAVRTLLRELLLHGSVHAPAGLLTQ